MERPKLPSTEEFLRAEDVVEGGAKRLFESHLEERVSYAQFVQSQFDEYCERGSHERKFQIICIRSGFTLAMSSLAVCTYTIYSGVNLFSLAAVIAPLSGLAGVYLFGFKGTKPSEGTEPLNPSDVLEHSEPLKLPK